MESPFPHLKSPLPYPLRKAWYSGYPKGGAARGNGFNVGKQFWLWKQYKKKRKGDKLPFCDQVRNKIKESLKNEERGFLLYFSSNLWARNISMIFWREIYQKGKPSTFYSAKFNPLLPSWLLQCKICKNVFAKCNNWNVTTFEAKCTAIKSKMLQFLDAKRNKLFNTKFINEKYVNLFTKKVFLRFSHIYLTILEG